MALVRLLPGLLADVSPERLVELCGDAPGNACRWMTHRTDNAALVKVADFVGGRLYEVAIIWIVAVIVNRAVRVLIKRVAGRLEDAAASGRIQRVRDRTPPMLLATGEVGLRSAMRAKTMSTVLRSMASVVIYSFALLYTLAALGLRVGPLVAGAGVVGVALGFGAQSMVRDFLSGTFMLIEDQFGVGDVIDEASTVTGDAGVVGTVERVTLRATRLRDVYGTVWHIPNGEIRRVGNLSQGWARALLDIPLPFEVDVDEATELINQLAIEVCHRSEFKHDILGEPEMWGIERIDNEGVVVRLVIKTRPGEQWRIMRALRAALKQAFDEHGIAFQLPTLWVREAPVAGTAASSPQTPSPQAQGQQRPGPQDQAPR
jgi:small conductance mechanosensitive channel